MKNSFRNRLFIVMAIFGIVFMSIGAVLMAAGVLVNGSLPFEVGSREVSYTRVDISESVDTFVLDVDYGDVYVYEAQAGESYIEYEMDDYHQFSTDQQLNILTINDSIGDNKSIGGMHDIVINLYVAEGSFVEGEIDLGSFTAKDCNLSYLNIVVDVGDICIKDVVCDDVSLTVDCGNIDADRIEVLDMDATVDVGSIELIIVGDKADFDIDVDVKVGSKNVLDQDGLSDKILVLKVDTGHIELTFE